MRPPIQQEKTMAKRGRTLLVVSLVVWSTTVGGQERRKFTPVRAVTEPVAASPRFDGGIVPVEVRHQFDFPDLNDTFEPIRDQRLTVIDGIEKIFETRSPALT